MSNEAADHQFGEAFCLMKYATRNGKESEVLWNSRNGVTPFGISMRSGRLGDHVEWQGDVRDPDHWMKLEAGDRIFVDLTREESARYRREYVDEWWDREVFGGYKMSEQWESKTEAVRAMVEDDMSHEGSPDVVEVTEDHIAAWKAAKEFSWPVDTEKTDDELPS